MMTMMVMMMMMMVMKMVMMMMMTMTMTMTMMMTMMMTIVTMTTATIPIAATTSAPPHHRCILTAVLCRVFPELKTMHVTVYQHIFNVGNAILRNE